MSAYVNPDDFVEYCKLRQVTSALVKPWLITPLLCNQPRAQSKRLGNFEYHALFKGKDSLVGVYQQELHSRLAVNLAKIDSDDPRQVTVGIMYTFLEYDRELYSQNRCPDHGCEVSLMLVDLINNRIYSVNLGSTYCLLLSDNKLVYSRNGHHSETSTSDIQQYTRSQSDNKPMYPNIQQYTFSQNNCEEHISPHRCLGWSQLKLRNGGYEPVFSAMATVPSIVMLSTIGNMKWLMLNGISPETSPVVLTKLYLSSDSLQEIIRSLEYHSDTEVQGLSGDVTSMLGESCGSEFLHT